MKNQSVTSLWIRLAGVTILALFFTLAAAAYFSGREVQRSSKLISTDAVPGMIAAHDMRMALSRSVGYMMVAASAQTTQSRDASIKIAHDADVVFANAITEYKATIKINPAKDRVLIAQVTNNFTEFQRQRMAYEALILAGNRDGSAAFLETNLVPAYVAAIQPAEALLKYNNGNSITYANYIRNSVNRLYWTVTVVMVLSLTCAAVLIMNLSIRKRAREQLEMLKVSVDKHFDAAYWMDANNQFVYVNDSACKALGYVREELLGKPITLVSPDSTPQHLEQVWKDLRETGFFSRESLHRCKDGLEFPVEVVASYVRFGGKEFSCGFARDITERKQLEQKQAELAAIVASSDDAIIGKSLKGIITSWNRGAEKIFGYSAAEAIGQPLLMLIPPDRQHEESDILEKIGRDEAVEHFETMRIRKDGRQIYISATISPLKDGLGKVVGASKIARDITERKQAEEDLRHSEDKYRRIFENVQDVFYQTDNSGMIIEISPSIERYSGYRREEVIGRPVESVYYNREDRNRLLKILHEKGEVVDYELRLKTKNGRLVYASTNSHVLLDSNGKPVGIEGALRDITERKRSQDELIWKTALLEAQADATIDAILIVDERGKRILQNQRLIELFKLPEEIAGDSDDTKMLQKTVSEMKHPKQFKERVDYLYAHPEEIGQEEIEFADGRVFDRYSAPVRDKTGKYYGRIWTFRDITEQRKLEEQFRQSQKMEAIGQLASGVAHDFNNILAIIQMQSHLLESGGNLSPVQQGYASGIGEATQRAAALTRQLLLFSRKEKMQPRELDLDKSVDDMTKMLRRTLGETVRLLFKFSSQPLFVCADAGMLDQVLMNLAVNARDAMPKGGKLVIETFAVELDGLSVVTTPQSRLGAFVCLSVSDTGTGIPPEIMPKIFDPFFTTKDVGKGTGLGLATVFGIVQQHNGWINVYSEIGQGTTFRIYLPRLARISDQKFVTPATESAPGGNETILVVEDEPKLRASVVNVLSHLGYNVLEASDGASAIEAWKKRRTQVLLAKKVWNQHRDEIHLLLTDMVMPGGMTGKDLGEELLKENPGLKVVYVSGYSAEVADKDFPLQEGVNFLAKPFQAQKLAQTIRNRLNS